MKHKVALIILSLLSASVFADNAKQGQLVSQRHWTTGKVTIAKNVKHAVRPSGKRLTFHPEGSENIITQFNVWGSNVGPAGGTFWMEGVPHVSLFNDDVKTNSYTVRNTVCINDSKDFEIGCARTESKFVLPSGSEIIDYNESNDLNVVLEEPGSYRVVGYLQVTKDDTDQRFTTKTEDYITASDDAAVKKSG